MTKNIIFVLASLFSLSLLGQTVYTEDQVILNNDSTLILDKSNNLPITGVYRDYYENGQLFQETHFKSGVSDGMCRFYYEQGQLISEYTNNEGKTEGMFTEYFENGQISKTGEFINDFQVGLWKAYDESGKIVFEEELMQGDMVNFNDDNSIYNFKKVGADGNIVSDTFFYPGFPRSVFAERLYEGGELVSYTDYYENGNIEIQELYNNEGVLLSDTYYHENGQLASQIDYKDGVELSWNCWDESGNEIACD